MASSNEESSAATKDKKSPPPFYIEGILRDTKEKKEPAGLGAEQPVPLLSAPTTCMSGAPSGLHVSSLTTPASSFISRPFPGTYLWLSC